MASSTASAGEPTLDDRRAVQVPRPETDHGALIEQGESDLGQRAVGAREGDHRVAAHRDKRVAGVAQPGRHGDLDPPVRLAAVTSGQDAERQPAGFCRAAARRLGDAATTTGHDHGARLRQQPAHLARLDQRRFVDLITPDH